jgi:hypothetical protein
MTSVIMLISMRVLPPPDSVYSSELTVSLFAAIVMGVSYGISVQQTDDPYIFIAEKALKGFDEAGVPGRFLADTFPVMKYIPSWFPGAGWKRMAESYAELNQDVCTKPFELIKQRIVGVQTSKFCPLPTINLGRWNCRTKCRCIFNQ